MIKQLSATITLLLVALIGYSHTKQGNIAGRNDGCLYQGTVVSDTIERRLCATNPLPLEIKKPKDKGVYTSISLGLLAGDEQNSVRNGFSLKVVSAYQTNNGISYGLGTGIEELGISLLPIFVGLNYFITNTKTSPFLSLKTGYGIALGKEGASLATSFHYLNPTSTKTKGGIMLSASVGVASFVFPKAAITISFGYHYQRIETTGTCIGYNYEPLYRTVFHNFNRMEVQFGILFK